MIRTFINSIDVDDSDTSCWGNINCSYETLIKVFGEETYCTPEGERNKSKCHWTIQFSDGTVATIYDYKVAKCYEGENGLEKNEIQKWHVGGHSNQSVQYVYDEVFQ